MLSLGREQQSSYIGTYYICIHKSRGRCEGESYDVLSPFETFTTNLAVTLICSIGFTRMIPKGLMFFLKANMLDGRLSNEITSHPILTQRFLIL